MEAEPWKTPIYDLRGKQLRYGDVALRTHVLVIDGFSSSENGAKHHIEFSTHRNYEKWDLIKYEKMKDGKQECCFSIATIVFENPKQFDYELVPVEKRLINDINGRDLKNLKKILKKVDDHCFWMRNHSSEC